MRPSLDETMLLTALVQAARGTCMKMQVGCVLTDARGRLLTANYNGVASGQPHCNARSADLTFGELRKYGMAGEAFAKEFPFACPGAFSPPGADLCEAVHCEQNALTQCLRPDEIRTAYLTCSPCIRCAKQLLNTPCERVVFLEEYLREPQARALWTGRGGRAWERADAAVQRKADDLARLLPLRLRLGVSPGRGGRAKA